MSSKMDLTAFAKSIKLVIKEPVALKNWEQGCIGFFDEIASLSNEKKSVLIGHIKGFLNLEYSGSFYFSTVGNQRGTTSRGEGKDASKSGQLDVNVLLYGLEEGEINIIVDRALSNLRKKLNITTIDIGVLKNENK